MTLRFDLGAFVHALMVAMDAYLVDAPLPLEPVGLSLEWPPRPPFRSDRSRIQALAALRAYEMIQDRLSASAIPIQTRAANFNRVALLALAAANHGIKVAAQQVGTGEATGRQRVKSEAIKSELARCLAEGVQDRAEMFRRAGVSRATGYRYLLELST